MTSVSSLGWYFAEKDPKSSYTRAVTLRLKVHVSCDSRYQGVVGLIDCICVSISKRSATSENFIQNFGHLLLILLGAMHQTKATNRVPRPHIVLSNVVWFDCEEIFSSIPIGTYLAVK